MLTLRRFLSAQYDWTGIASKLLQSKAWYLGSLISVAFVVLLLIVGYHLWYVGMGAKDFATTPLGLEHMFPLITYYTLTVILVPLLLLFSRVFRIWRLTMGGERQARPPLSLYVLEAWVYVYQTVSESLMRKCPEKGRWLGHWIMAMRRGHNVNHQGLRSALVSNRQPLPLVQSRSAGSDTSPRASSSMASEDIFVGRLRAQKEIYKETSFQDLVFPVLLRLTAFSGLAAHIFRYDGFALTCHYMYALHVIIATPMLVVEMSFGKWSHMVYRPLALYFLAVKERAAQQAPAAEVVPHAALTNPKPHRWVLPWSWEAVSAACRRPLISPTAASRCIWPSAGPAIGGVMAQLDKTFPTNDCAMCTMAPRLVEIGRHKDIDILTLTEVERVEGQPGNFTVSNQAAAAFH